MTFKKMGLLSVMLAAALTMNAMPATLAAQAETTLSEAEALEQGAVIENFSEEDADAAEIGEIGAFRPADCGVPAQEVYEYPYIGLTAKLTQAMRAWMDSRDVFVAEEEAYDEMDLDYAQMRFFALTEEQKTREVMSVDFYAWQDELEKIGVLGVYQADQSAQLDALTGCDTHEKLGESADGAYVYYLSTNASGNAELVQELCKTEVSISEMREMDFERGGSAFSVGRVDGVANVGDFITQDVFGQEYTQEIFAEYDLTLVNAFATWCSPCVNEIPELEQLRQAFAEKGIKLGVVGMVMDAKTQSGVDENAVDLAKTLYERSGAQFPFLIPDEGELNGRLKGLEAYPESFFVDSDGNIVSDPYVGANDLEGWTQVVEEELAKLSGEN